MMSIQASFYDMTDEEKNRYIKKMKRKIANGNDTLLQEMMSIVDEEVMKYEEDFYVDDIELLKDVEKDESVLWIVRNHGTHFIYLSKDSFNKKGEWDNAEYFRAIIQNYKNRICGYYLIEKGKLKKINEKSAFAVLAIHEDIARNKQEYQKSRSTSII